MYSTKFWRKVHFVPTLQALSEHVKIDEDYISAPVAAVDRLVMSKKSSSQKYTTGPSTDDTEEEK